MQYTISVYGTGAECRIFPLTKQQKKKLVAMDIEANQNIPLEEILNVLGEEDVFESILSSTGVYDESGEFSIEVSDQDGNVMMEHEYAQQFEFFDYSEIYNDGDYLIIANNIKGNILNYEIQTAKTFDVEKITLVSVDVGSKLNLITDLMYAGKDITKKKEYGDYQIDGCSYYLALEN